MIRRRFGALLDWVYGVSWWLRAFSRSGSPDAFREPGPDPDHRTPIVLLPGIWERWPYLVPLARWLNAAGHPVHLIAALGANGSPLPVAERIVADYLTAERLERVILVAHSKGGLVGKLAMLDPSCAERILGMVALSTPFGGSSLSWPIFGRTPLAVFAPRGAAITELAAQLEVNARIISVQPTHDQVIPEGSRLQGARNVRLEATGHFRPLRDAEVHRVIHELVHEPFAG